MWAYLTQTLTLSEIADLFSVPERTARRYIHLFYHTGDVQLSDGGKHGPQKLLGDHELVLLRMILTRPDIYLHELQTSLHEKFGVAISLPTICRTLQYMGCTRQTMHHVAIQRSDELRARFMVEILLYDPTMLVWLDETGCN